jgi:hypothetical protein
MPQSTHDRAAELRSLASHAHSAATTGRGKGDQLTAHEQSRQAHERSMTADEHAEKLRTEEASTGRT